MPPHHHHQPKYCDFWYDDLPEGAKAAAADLQYTKEIWDGNQYKTLPYWNKSFGELTDTEKAAMMYLSMSPIWYNGKDTKWSALDKDTKRMATLLGYDPKEWDHHDELPFHGQWEQMMDEQRLAAAYFGYNQVTWDCKIDGTNYQPAGAGTTEGKACKLEHTPKYCDYWYADLPQGAQAAAADLGYTQEIWDGNQYKTLPYCNKSFGELTSTEKEAMIYLAMPPAAYKFEHTKWPELDEETKEIAKLLGYEPHSWDHEIRNVPCDNLLWSELSEEQRDAAAFFGYSRVTWDRVVDGFNYGTEPSYQPASAQEEKKEEEEEELADVEEAVEVHVEEAAEAAAEPEQAPSSQPTAEMNKITFKMSRYFGKQSSGEAFDHHNNRSIKEITVYAGGIVDGLHVTYGNGAKKVHGGVGGIAQGDIGAKKYSFQLDQGEEIVGVFVRADPASFVQAIRFTTNKGKNHGPFGGKGRPIKDKPGKEHTIRAPKGYRLVGLAGYADKTHITAIAFRWGPKPTQK